MSSGRACRFLSITFRALSVIDAGPGAMHVGWGKLVSYITLSEYRSTIRVSDSVSNQNVV